ncbi:unnamed protein product [Pedinophyceae sp. YPF-701]|nr:unnamed protein product [Pedinophyceae sp. YPF-701]
MALELARNGVPVTVVDRADRPGTVSTAASWAWLNANRKEPVHYRELNLMGMDIWKTDPLLSQLADFNGCIVLDDATGGQGEAYPSDPLTQDQLTAAEPGLAPLAAPPAHGTRIYRQEGLCDPVQATEAILAEAERLGARVIFGQSADYVHVEGGGVRLTLSGEAEAVEADAVVLAGGVDARTLAAGLGTEVPMLHRPGILVHTAPMPPGTLKHIVVAPSCYMLQRRDGVVVIGEDQNGSAGGARADDASADNGQRVLSVAARVLPALAGTELGRVTLGMRPYPADGLPVVGWLPRHEGKAYLMVSHSGVTLAPAIARLATKQILGQEVPALAHYATDRDFGTQGDNPYDLQFHGSGEQAMKREATAN